MPESNQEQERPPKKKPKPPGVWGLTDLQALEAFQAKTVDVHMATGEVLTGDLVGYGPFTLTLKVDDRIVVANKGGISWYTTAGGNA